MTQPPSGGCVLKRENPCRAQGAFHQPPSGGCVLKRLVGYGQARCPFQPPSGGCVLKRHKNDLCRQEQGPAAFRRLCVETLGTHTMSATRWASRLQAAVC